MEAAALPAAPEAIGREEQRREQRAGAARVLLVAPARSYRIAAYCRAAGAVGVRLVLASGGINPLIAQAADGLHVDFSEPERSVRTLLAAMRDAPMSAVVATDDVATEIASRVAEAAGLPHNPPSAARIARRKDLARATLSAAGVRVPRFRTIDLHRPLEPQIAGVGYPCVVKPLAMSASRGVIRADTPGELLAACGRVERIVRDCADEEERGTLLLEDFIPGFEVAVEGILQEGRLRPLAIFDKPEPLDGPFFEETYYVTPSRLDSAQQALILERVAEACLAYGLREGPVHAELRVNSQDAWIIEVAARTIGGECARLLDFGTGTSLEELVLTHALGHAPIPGPIPGPSTEAAGVLMIPTTRAGTLRRVEGVLEASRVPGVEDVMISVREGYELVPLPEGGSYLGFVFARGASSEEVESALREAHARLEVVVAPAWRLEAGAGGVSVQPIRQARG